MGGTGDISDTGGTAIRPVTGETSTELREEVIDPEDSPTGAHTPNYEAIQPRRRYTIEKMCADD